MDSSSDTVEGIGETVRRPGSESKGKGIDHRLEDVSPVVPKDSDTSPVASTSYWDTFPRRIFNSAAGLSAAFQGPGGYASWATSSLSGGEKEAGSSSASTRTELPFTSRSVGSGTALNQPFHRPSLAHTDKGTEFDSLVQQPMPNTAAEVERHGESRLATAGSIAEQERLDGNEVVAILEAPNLDFDDSEGIDTMLSTEGAQRLHAALFSDTADHRIHWDNLLNFWPDQGRRVFDEQNGQRLFGGGETLSPQAAWLRDWKDVLVHYADEVWGDLGLVAIQARGEVETAAESKSLPPLEALGRLRMILLHLRGAQ